MSVRVTELTPSGPGGVSVLSVEGPAALRALAALLAPERRVPRPGALVLLPLSSGGDVLDEALVWVRSADAVEIGLHGSSAVVRRVRAALEGPEEGAAAAGARLRRSPESPGGSIEDRARALLAQAPSEAAARILLDQAEGALRAGFERLARADPGDLAGAVAAMLERARWLERALHPATVVLAGPVNAGKSTLFNVLVGRERTVVSATAGTTRDLVRERVRLGQWPVDLVDAAGDREVTVGAGPASGAVARELEARGQTLARASWRRADLVLWLDPRGGDPPPDVPAVALCSRAAEHLAVPPGGREPSGAASDAGGGGARPRIAALERPAEADAVVARAFREALDLPEDPWRPGEPVPFEPCLARAAAAIAAEPDRERRRGRIAEVLRDVVD